MNSKILIGTGVIGTAVIIGLGAYWFFSKSNQNKQKIFVHPQLEQLSKHIDKNHPSQTQIHQLYSFISSEAKKKSSSFILKFKNQRRKIKSQNFSQYIKFIQQSFIKVKANDIQTKQQILSQLQITQQQFNNAVIRFSGSFSQPFTNLSNDLPVLSVQKLRKIIKSQIDILETRGLDILTNIQKQIGSTNKQNIQQIFNAVLQDQILNVVQNDQQIFQKHEQTDTSSLLQRSSIAHRDQLRQEIQKVNGILVNIFSKIQQ